MIRRLMLGLAVAGLMAAGANAQTPVVTEAREYSISSSVATFGNPTADKFIFDFPAPEGVVNKLNAISVEWTVDLPDNAVFTDPQPTGSFLTLNGDLQYGLNENIGTGFLLTVPKTGGDAIITVTKRPITEESGNQLLADLLDDGTITTEFSRGGDFGSFFAATGGAGPSVTAKMTLFYEGERGAGGGGGGNEPEPASILIWGAAATGLALRRRFARS